MPKGQEAALAERLRKFCEVRDGQWDHQAWIELLGELDKEGIKVLHPDEIGLRLEKIKADYWAATRVGGPQKAPLSPKSASGQVAADKERRVWACGSQLPGFLMYECPFCRDIYNLSISKGTQRECRFHCPKCNQPYIIVFEVKSTPVPPHLPRVRLPNLEVMQAWKCPCCGAFDSCYDTGVLLGQYDREYVAACSHCGCNYVRELP
jgi:hypothetical protein